MPSVYFETLGCAKNEVDTRTMKSNVASAGFDVVDCIDESDIIVVNTCSFIQSATEESIEAIFDALGEGGATSLQHADTSTQSGERVSLGKRPVVVTGCMPARFGSELESALPEVAHFIPCGKEDNIAAVLCEALGLSPSSLTAAPVLRDEPAPQAAWAYVKISDGCNRWCSFCTIPAIRGPYHSFSYETIYNDVAQLVSLGTKEIVLIGQDTGIWGSDLVPTRSLADLLESLAGAFPETLFRVMYTEPEGITDALLDVIGTHDNICSYLDIPLQHVVPCILHDMRRNGSADEFSALVMRIRSAIPRITLRTTLIAGFPGESEEDFEELLSFVQEGYFDYVGVFAYSQEEGTKAAELENQIPDDVKQARARELRDAADSVSAALVAERVGETCTVLIEAAEEDGQLYGRAECQAPEVDGVTYVDRGIPGEFVSVSIEDTLLYDMEGIVL